MSGPWYFPLSEFSYILILFSMTDHIPIVFSLKWSCLYLQEEAGKLRVKEICLLLCSMDGRWLALLWWSHRVTRYLGCHLLRSSTRRRRRRREVSQPVGKSNRLAGEQLDCRVGHLTHSLALEPLALLGVREATTDADGAIRAKSRPPRTFQFRNNELSVHT